MRWVVMMRWLWSDGVMKTMRRHNTVLWNMNMRGECPGKRYFFGVSMESEILLVLRKPKILGDCKRKLSCWWREKKRQDCGWVLYETIERVLWHCCCVRCTSPWRKKHKKETQAWEDSMNKNTRWSCYNSAVDEWKKEFGWLIFKISILSHQL